MIAKRLEYDKLKLKMTTLTVKRSVVVNFGKMMEEITSELSTFPFHGADLVESQSCCKWFA